MLFSSGVASTLRGGCHPRPLLFAEFAGVGTFGPGLRAAPRGGGFAAIWSNVDPLRRLAELDWATSFTPPTKPPARAAAGAAATATPVCEVPAGLEARAGAAAFSAGAVSRWSRFSV